MKNKRLIVAGLAVLVGVSVPAFLAVQNASAASPCVVGPVGYRNLVANPDHTITGTFEVKGDAGCAQPVNLATFSANSALLGTDAYYTTQKPYDATTQTFGLGVHTLTVKLPVCMTDPNVAQDYQADIIASAGQDAFVPTAAVPGYFQSTQADGSPVVVDWNIGSGKCPAAPANNTVTTVSSTTPPATTSAPVSQPGPSTLVNTGPGKVAAGMFALSTLGGTLLYRKLALKRA